MPYPVVSMWFLGDAATHPKLLLESLTLPSEARTIGPLSVANILPQLFTYKIGDRVLLERPGILPQMSTPRTGPYVIQQTFTNGTVQIQKGVVSHCVNIRRLTPYFE